MDETMDELCPPSDASLLVELRTELVGELNKTLVDIGKSPVRLAKLRHDRYVRKKFSETVSAIGENIFGLSDEVCVPQNEIIEQLKAKFQKTSRNDEKVMILTILPQSWKRRKIEDEFSVSSHMAQKAIDFVKEKGVLSSPDPRAGKTIPDEVKQMVQTFYSSDEYSRLMPGMKDFVTIREKEERKRVQKKLILCNLRKLYIAFKRLNEGIKIGFSKFAALRPRNCILAGASGTHSVCVCVKHQYFKLMIEGADNPKLTKLETHHLPSYKECSNMTLCEAPGNDCWLGGCKDCPGPSPLINFLENIFENNSIEEITYKQWTHTDRSQLETFTNSTEEFLDKLEDKIPELAQHSFIAKRQKEFLDFTKFSLKHGEYVVLLDFAENYTMVIQDETQGYHWSGIQATIHSFVIYHEKSDPATDLPENLVIISDCLRHDTCAVHLFQKYLLNFLKEKHGEENVSKIFYFSDGAASQYKNKKHFYNLTLHEADFNVSAEHHFFATAHGKGLCDSIGATVKRNAARASLQRPYLQQITSARDLFLWAKDHLKNINAVFVSDEEYKRESALLADRFERAKTIHGTQQYHAFIPIGEGLVQAKKCSFSTESKQFHVSDNDE